MRESTIEKTVCDWARKKGAIVLKLSGPNAKGQPDRMFLLGRKVCFIEFKATGARPTALQEKWLADLRSHGFNAAWIDSAPEAIAWLKDVLNIK